MRKLCLLICCAVVLAVGAAPALADHSEGHTFTLSPLNGSSVSGEGTIEFGGDGVTANVQASGLTPDQVHEVHIHGIDGQDVSCPTGMVGHEDMEAAVGGHVLDLEPFPTADANGNISIEQTYMEGVNALDPIENRIVAVHGMNMDGEYMAEMPVACGEIELSGEESASTVPETGGPSLGLLYALFGAGALAAGAALLMRMWRSALS